MKSIKCLKCGLVNFAEVSECKRCKAVLADAPQPARAPLEKLPSRPKEDEAKAWRAISPLFLMVMFGVPLIFALQNKFAGRAKPGGAVENLDNKIILVCGGGLLVSIIVSLWRKR